MKIEEEYEEKKKCCEALEEELFHKHQYDKSHTINCIKISKELLCLSDNLVDSLSYDNLYCMSVSMYCPVTSVAGIH